MDRELAISPPPGLPDPGCLADVSGWMHRLLTLSGLDDHLGMALTWAHETGCIEQDLLRKDVLQELIDHLSLKRFPAERLRRSCEHLVGSAAAMQNICHERAGDACSESTVSTSKCVEDGRFENGCVEEILQDSGQASLSADVNDGSTGLSKSAKKRARKQARDAAYVAEKATLPKRKPNSSSKADVLPPSAKKSSAQVTDESAMQYSGWSVTKVGCKAHAEAIVPAFCVGRIIGPNGSTIKYFERSYLITARVVSQKVIIDGKQDRVQRTMAHIDKLIWDSMC